MLKSFFLASKRIKLKQAWFFLTYALITIALAVGTIYESLFIAEMTVSAYYANEETNIWRIVYLLIAIGLFNIVFFTAQTRSLALFAAKAASKFRLFFSEILIKLPHRVVSQKQTGDIISIYSNDIPEASKFISGMVIHLLPIY